MTEESHGATVRDRGSHIEVFIAAGRFRQFDLADTLSRASKTFAARSILVICGDAAQQLGLQEAYRLGIDLAAQLPFHRIAIALHGRGSSESEAFAELVAANRGAQVRYFEGVPAAKAWLGV